MLSCYGGCRRGGCWVLVGDLTAVSADDSELLIVIVDLLCVTNNNCRVLCKRGTFLP